MTCAEGRLLLTKLDMSRSLPEIRYSIRVHAENSQALRVIQACSTSVKGNCRGNTDVDAAEQTCLQHRNSHKS